MRLNEFEAVSSKYKGFKEKAAEAETETETKVEKSTRPFFVPLRGHFEEFRKIKDFIIPPPPPG